MVVDTFALIARGRVALADELAALDPDEWAAPSRCAGWSVHVVAAHLNLPWSVSTPRLVATVVRSGGIDRAFDRLSRDLAGRLDPAACVAGLRANAAHRFTPPGLGPVAPLTDVLIHGDDMLGPLGRAVAPDAEALAASLTWLASGRARGFVPRGRTDGLVLVATDLAMTAGSGEAEVAGPALALCGALAGRRDALGQLDGPGLGVLAGRL